MPSLLWALHRAQIVGDYRLGATIGAGQFGTVREAEHTITGAKVAVKIVEAAKVERHRLMEEIRLQRLCKHSRVAEIIDVIERSGAVYIVMEHVAGGDLVDYLLRGVLLAEEDARRIFGEIVEAVAHCHGMGVTHRDLKPDNILLDANLHVKLADFGCAAEMAAGTSFSEFTGSTTYAAPELLASGCSYQGDGVDVWACGCILYALLCNSLPFDGQTLPELVECIQHGVFQIPGHVSESAASLIKGMLTVDASHRLSIAEIRAHPWQLARLAPPLRCTKKQKTFSLRPAPPALPARRRRPAPPPSTWRPARLRSPALPPSTSSRRTKCCLWLRHMLLGAAYAAEPPGELARHAAAHVPPAGGRDLVRGGRDVPKPGCTIYLRRFRANVCVHLGCRIRQIRF